MILFDFAVTNICRHFNTKIYDQLLNQSIKLNLFLARLFACPGRVKSLRQERLETKSPKSGHKVGKMHVQTFWTKSPDIRDSMPRLLRQNLACPDFHGPQRRNSRLDFPD